VPCRAMLCRAVLCCSLSREADAVGFPLLVKAVSGGGGKGMKIAANKVCTKKNGGLAAMFMSHSKCWSQERAV